MGTCERQFNHKDTAMDHVKDMRESVLDAGARTRQLVPLPCKVQGRARRMMGRAKEKEREGSFGVGVRTEDREGWLWKYHHGAIGIFSAEWNLLFLKVTRDMRLTGCRYQKDQRPWQWPGAMASGMYNVIVAIVSSGWIMVYSASRMNRGSWPVVCRVWKKEWN